MIAIAIAIIHHIPTIQTSKQENIARGKAINCNKIREDDLG